MNPSEIDFIKVKVVDYDDRWPDEFQKEAELLASAFKENLIKVFHIGSTSVPGLKAKPVIDIMPVVCDINKVDSLAGLLSVLGYEGLGELGICGRRYFRKGGQNRTHQIHAFQYDNTHHILRHLAFRDYLRAHPDICAEYGALKSKLAAQYPEDIGKYCDGKDSFVKNFEREALKWLWEQYGTALF